MFTTILWDLDGTLLDFKYSERMALKNTFDWAGLTFSEEILEKYSGINDSYWKRLELGEVTRKELLVGRFKDLFSQFGIENVDVEGFRLEYQTLLGQYYSYLENSLELCRRLTASVSQYIITNGVSSTQYSKLRLSGIADCMNGVFVSEDIGADKPDPLFFEIVLERIREKDKTKILVVGDSVTSDIKGGRGAGLKTCWYRPQGCINETPWKADYEISSIWQVLDIIKFGNVWCNKQAERNAEYGE